MKLNAKSGGIRPLVAAGVLAVVASFGSAQGLLGTYTVDSSLPTGGANYTNLNDAVVALTTMGVSGPVTMELIQRTPLDFTVGMPWRALVNGAGAFGGSAILTLDQFPGVSATNRVTFRTSATSPTQPVAFNCGVNNVGVGIFFQGADYVTIENIEIKNAVNDGIMFYGETQMIASNNALSTMEFDIIRRCRIHDCNGTGITLYGNSSQPGNILIENHYFWDNMKNAIGAFTNFGRFGHISTRRSNNVTIRHNSFYQGVPMASTVAGAIPPCFIGANSNTGTNFAMVSGNAFMIGAGAGASVARGFYCWLVQGTFTNLPGTGTGFASGVALGHDRNVYFNQGTGTTFAFVNVTSYTALAQYRVAVSATADLNSTVGDPLFTNPSAGNLDLTGIASPCVNAGLTGLGIVDDIYGLPRLGTAPDIGAHEAPLPGLSAAFTQDVTAGAAALTVNFTDLSTTGGGPAITTWAWDFDGDNLTDSTQQNPSWTYAVPGTYSVRLTVNNGGTPATITQTNLIHVAQYPFLVSTTGGGVGDLGVIGIPSIGLPGAAQGYTLISTATAGPVGSGWFLGLTFDALTWTILSVPASPGNPLHFQLGFPGLFPGTAAPSPLILPGGSLNAIFPTGLTLDFVMVYLDGVGNYVYSTPVQRITV